MSAVHETGPFDLKAAVSKALDLLSEGEPRQAMETAQAVLDRHPDEANSQLVVAAALRELGNNAEALQRLLQLVTAAPDFPLALQELGFAYAEAGQTAEAIRTLKQAVSLEPKLPACWRLMAELYLAEDDERAAAESSSQYLLASSEEPALIKAVQLFRAGNIGQAERICRGFLTQKPSNVTAIRLLAEIGTRVGAFDDAEKLLTRCLELAPDFRLARLNYAHVLNKREKLEEALAQVSQLLDTDPRNFPLSVLKASTLVKIGDFDQAIVVYRELLTDFPPRPKVTLSYAHALKTVGHLDEAVTAYRQTIDLQPDFGDAYWSQANLKTFRFEDTDIDAMREQIDKRACSQEDFFHFCFALGKALQDRERYEESFHYYELGNGIKQKLEAYDTDRNHEQARNIQSVCTRELFSAADGQGCKKPDPIFIVGLPRSGSTLLEQILASHSQVDGTKELVHIQAIVARLSGKRKRSDESRYPGILTELSAAQFQELGEEYLARSQIQRGTAPFFIDKAPNNFLHAGLIKLILPNAKIIDARRHPMGSCFSAYIQLFAKGQAFTYGLSNVGRYYRDYLAVMDHWDQVLPGKVLCVEYEEVVADTETQVRRVLDYCGLPFEEACLQFYLTDRAVRTPSSEQVRQPIYSGGLDYWRHYEPWLDDLKDALGPVLQRYPIN